MSNPVQPQMSAPIRKKSSSVADYLLFRQQNPGISSLPATVELTSVFPSVQEIRVAASSSSGSTAASSSSQSFTERIRATNPPRVRPNAVASTGSPIEGEVSGGEERLESRIWSSSGRSMSLLGRPSRANPNRRNERDDRLEASRLKIKATQAAADHIRHVADLFIRRGPAFFNTWQPNSRRS